MEIKTIILEKILKNLEEAILEINSTFLINTGIESTMESDPLSSSNAEMESTMRNQFFPN